MTQVGGPAALNGFLYQILQHIGWLAEARLSNSRSGGALGDSWTVVLEPQSGGDAQLHSGEYVVEQYKTRIGTWSLRALQRDVLSDLRRAVPFSLPARAAYRFVTNGRPGRGVAALLEFFERLKLVSSPDQLDARELHTYDAETFTDVTLFQHLCEQSRPLNSAAWPTERERVFHLLTHFEAAWEYSAQRLTAKIDALLRQYFPGPHDVQMARANLLGVIFQRLAAGEIRLGPNEVRELFLQVNLDPDVPQRLARLAETLALIMTERMGRAGYIRSQDVRTELEWPTNRPVLVITGESGSGKSWQLARLIYELAARRQVVTWSIARQSATSQIDQIAQDLWTAGLHQHGARTLASLELYYREWMPGTGHWLTAAVDDIHDAGLARQLVERDEWSGNGARLVMSTSFAIARDLESRFPTSVHVVNVGEFGVVELDSYLQIHGRRWFDLPDDLKQLLKKPILAGLYVRLPYSSFVAMPRSEYEIFDGYWERMKARAEPGDAGLLLALAARTLDKTGYPIARTQWRDVGADAHSVRRLVTLGWVRIGDADEIAFSHDRLLNWAVGLELCHRVRAGSITEADLARLLRTCFTEPGAFARPLGYVLMDVLWMLATKPPRQFDIAAVLIHLEEDGHAAVDLYEDLLPTLGGLAVGWIVTRLKAVACEKDARTIYLRKGLEAVALQDNVRLHNVIDDLLVTDVVVLQRIALGLLRLQPRASYLEPLWAMRGWYSRDRTDAHIDAPLWSGAMRACAALDADWLIRRVTSRETEPGDLADLGYILAGLESPRAASVWTQVSRDLTTRVPRERSRGVLYCIRRFSDQQFIDYCLERLGDQAGLLDGAALSALVRISPDIALAHLERVADTTRRFTILNWLPELLARRPEDCRARLLELASEGSGVTDLIGSLFGSFPDDMGTDLLTAYLDSFEARLTSRAPAGKPADDEWLHTPLHILGRLADPENLKILRLRQGSALERLLHEAARRRVGKFEGWRDSILESARLTLLRIAGPGIRELVLFELASSEYWGRHGGLLWAEVAGVTAATHLQAIACRCKEAEDSQSHAHTEAYLAFTKLATIGADLELVQAIWQVGTHCLSRDLPTLRGDRPMDSSLLSRAGTVLQDSAVDDALLERALAIAWLSCSTDMLPSIRARLSALTPGSQAAALASHALFVLGDRSDETVHFAKRLLAVDKSRWMGVNLLLAVGEAGLPVLQAHLNCRPPEQWDDLDHIIIETMHAHVPTRSLAVEAAALELSRHSWRLDTPPFDIAAESTSPQTRDRILEAAFSTDRTMVGRSVKAIRATAQFDLERALEAARLELVATPKTADSVCRAVTETAPQQATAWLIDVATSLPSDRLAAIGRALRRLPVDDVRAALTTLLGSELPTQRCRGLALAAWCAVPEQDRLTEILMTDLDGIVRDGALAALRRRRELARSKRLMDAIRSQTEVVQWSLLQALIASTPRDLLIHRQDELWLGHVLDDLPMRFETFAREQLRRERGDEQ